MTASRIFEGTSLGTAQQETIKKADTCFIASTHPNRSVDVSHRGGNPGFVRVMDAHTLRIPGYDGNALFNTFGNFVLNPEGGLVFIDFDEGASLQLIGHAEILWDMDDAENEPGGTLRFWEFHIERWFEIKKAHEIEWSFLDHSPYNSKKSQSAAEHPHIQQI